MNNHLLIAGTSAGLPAWKKVAAPLMLSANQAMCRSVSLIRSKGVHRDHLYARHNVHLLEPYMELMLTPFSDQLSMI